MSKVEIVTPNTLATLAQRYDLSKRTVSRRLRCVGAPRRPRNQYTGEFLIPPEYVAQADLLFVLQSSGLLSSLSEYETITAPCAKSNPLGLGVQSAAQVDHFSAVATWLQREWRISPAQFIDLASVLKAGHPALKSVRHEFARRGLIDTPIAS